VRIVLRAITSTMAKFRISEIFRSGEHSRFQIPKPLHNGLGEFTLALAPMSGLTSRHLSPFGIRKVPKVRTDTRWNLLTIGSVEIRTEVLVSTLARPGNEGLAQAAMNGSKPQTSIAWFTYCKLGQILRG
jgi:hypothetical protein